MQVNSKDKEMRNTPIGEAEADRKTGGRAMGETSLAETSKILKLSLSLEVYGELVREALRRGCTPEQLVAQQIDQLANASGKCAIP